MKENFTVNPWLAGLGQSIGVGRSLPPWTVRGIGSIQPVESHWSSHRRSFEWTCGVTRSDAACFDVCILSHTWRFHLRFGLTNERSILRKYTVGKFITHDAIAQGVFNKDTTTACASSTAWQSYLLNTKPILDLVCDRLGADYANMPLKFRKAYTYSQIESCH